jgi:hypothetical protein
MTVEKRRNPGPMYRRTWHKNIGTLLQDVTEQAGLCTTSDHRD